MRIFTFVVDLSYDDSVMDFLITLDKRWFICMHDFSLNPCFLFLIANFSLSFTWEIEKSISKVKIEEMTKAEKYFSAEKQDRTWTL